MDLVLLEMKLHEVHFAVKFSEAEAEENLTAKCTKCNFIPMSTRCTGHKIVPINDGIARPDRTGRRDW